MENSNDSDPRPTSRYGMPPFWWVLFTAVWLVFPVFFAVRIVSTGLSPVGTVLFLLSTSVFVGIFALLMLRYPFPDVASTFGELRGRIVLIGILAALAFYIEIAFAGDVYPDEIPYRFMYVVIASAIALPLRFSVYAVSAAVISSCTLYLVSWGPDVVLGNLEALIPFALLGVGMIALSRFVVTIRELDAARKEIARLAVSEERLRFARDLHDLLGHSLSLITLKSELAGRLLPNAPDRAASEVHDIEDVAREALKEVREAVAGYRRPTLAGELSGAREMLEAAEIDHSLADPPPGLSPAADAVLAWTVREGVTNVIRHSRARRCEVSISAARDSVKARISDDGENARTVTTAGSGLSGLSERVRALGGEFSAGPVESGGFEVRVEIPMDGKVSENTTKAGVSGT